MFKKLPLPQVTFTLLLSAYAVSGWAQEKLEGLVTSTKLTVCKFEPGGCAGDLKLEVQRDGKVVQVPVKVPLGTPIKKGDEIAYLPALRKNRVAISYVEEKGQKVAKSIAVITSEKP